MFFFLVFHTKITSTNDIEKKIITTLVYGTMLYVIFHVMLNTSQKAFFVTMRQYFWLMLLVDIVSLMLICRTLLAKLSDKTRGSLSGVGKRIVGFLEGMIDTGMYSDVVNFDNQTDDVITDIEELKKRTGILKQKSQIQNTNNSYNNETERSVSFSLDNNKVEYIPTTDEQSGTVVDPEELKEITDLVNQLSTSAAPPYTQEYNPETQQQSYSQQISNKKGIGSTSISELKKTYNAQQQLNLREGELPDELQPIYTVPKNSGRMDDNGRRVLRNPLQPDLAPLSNIAPPPPECVTPDNNVIRNMQKKAVYNPDIWDDQEKSPQNQQPRAPSEPDFSKPLSANDLYTGSELQGTIIPKTPSSENKKRSTSISSDNDDSRSEVSEFDIDLNDFEQCLT